MTRFEKGVIPIVVVSAVVIGGVTFAVTRPLEQTWWSLLMGLLFIVVFAIAYRFRIWPLADEVFDGGDHLLVRRRGEEQRVRFEDIADLSLSRSGKSHRMTVELKSPGRFGEKIVFLPHKHLSFNPFAQDPLEKELLARVAAARKGVRA